MDGERNLGEQPVAQIMAELGLKAHDLVAASEEPVTHKMVARACRGRWLTPHTRLKILRALSKAGNQAYTMSDLFNY